MICLKNDNCAIEYDEASGMISSLTDFHREYVKEEISVFEMALRDGCGKQRRLTAAKTNLKFCESDEDGFVCTYEGDDVTVTVRMKLTDDPYRNALPHIRRLEEEPGSRILVLLMHWEGTAPWAPPYVWPPYGGEEALKAFIDALHERGDLLGVYCSGLGRTQQSNLVKEYNREKQFEEQG